MGQGARVHMMPSGAACWEGEYGKVIIEAPRKVPAGSGARRADKTAPACALDPEACPAEAAPASDSGGKPGSHPHPSLLATFRELYRSRDGRFVIFEDKDGHLTSVNSSRFA